MFGCGSGVGDAASAAVDAYDAHTSTKVQALSPKRNNPSSVWYQHQPCHTLTHRVTFRWQLQACIRRALTVLLPLQVTCDAHL